MEDILNKLKSQRQASKQCLASDAVSKEDKEVLQQNQNLINYSYYATKALIAAGFMTLVDWKRPAPIIKRQVPYAFLAFALCALADFATYKYAFSKTQNILVKYTGFRDGIFVNPDKFSKMRTNFRNQQGGRVYQQNQDDLIQ